MQNEIIYGPTLAGEEDVYLFREGTHRRIYDFLGAHPLEHEGRPGVLFACLLYTSSTSPSPSPRPSSSATTSASPPARTPR